MRNLKPNSRGFTLMEALVGLACALIVLLGAVGFAHYEIRTLGISRDNLEMTQAGRMSLDLMLDDLANAGAGIGYNEAGAFAGLENGRFLRNGAEFFSNNGRLVQIDNVDVNAPDTATGFPTDDIGLTMAEGQYVTITFWGATAGQVCGPSGFSSGDIVLVRSADGISAKSVQISSVTIGAGCVSGTSCQMGCEDITYVADPDSSYRSSAFVDNVNYSGGTMAGGFKQITWFITASDPNRPQLRRLIGSCPTLDDTCGDLVSDNVDSLHMRVFERIGATWSDRTDLGITAGSANPVRVDVELVLRAARSDVTGQGHPHARLVLEDRCLPGPDVTLPGACQNQASPNLLRRLVLRASVELKNAGHMRIN